MRWGFLIFFLLALALVGGLHAYLWVRLVRDPALVEPWRRIATVTIVALALSIPIGFAAHRAAPRPYDEVVPAVAFTWLGLWFLLLCAVAALDLVRVAGAGLAAVAGWLGSRPIDPADPERRIFLARALAGTAVAATAGASALAFRSATGPAEVTEVPVRLERLPRALSGLTIVQISDVHAGPTIREGTLRRIVDQVNALRPDVVAVTGDLVDEGVRELAPVISHLGRLSARHGVFFVTGNHEYYAGVEPWLVELRRLGLRILSNERVEIGDRGASLDLAGIDDWSSHAFGDGRGPDLRRALAGRDPERSLVLLAHQPRVNAVAQAVQAGVELQISGHTHGGQIAPFNLLVRSVFPYLKGLYQHDEAGRSGQVFVSRGTGYWGPPLRLGSPPEIAKIVLTT